MIPALVESSSYKYIKRRLLTEYDEFKSVLKTPFKSASVQLESEIADVLTYWFGKFTAGATLARNFLFQLILFGSSLT